jgi:FKBP-type peptidyl-prolyl cis-trans isomerase SlyD
MPFLMRLTEEAHMSTIAKNRIISIDYVLTNDEGEQLDSSTERGPLTYLHGANNIVPGLEKVLADKTIGDTFTVKIPPEEGYGVMEGPGPQPVPRESFPPNTVLEVGVSYMVELEEGVQRTVWIAQVTEQLVFLDMNHPLAGETLHFDVTVREIRDASPAEIAQGYPA